MLAGAGAEGSAVPLPFPKWGWVNKTATDLDRGCVNKRRAMMGISSRERGNFSFIPALCENPEVFSQPMDRHSHLASSQKC